MEGNRKPQAKIYTAESCPPTLPLGCPAACLDQVSRPGHASRSPQPVRLCAVLEASSSAPTPWWQTAPRCFAACGPAGWPCFPATQSTPPPPRCTNVYTQVSELLLDCPGDALMLLPGLLVWSGMLANGNIRRKSKFGRGDTGWHQFWGDWILHVAGWQLLPTTPPVTDPSCGG